MDLPGLEKDKINVRVSGNHLILEGERKIENQQGDKAQGFFATEVSYGSFTRTLMLPAPVDETKVTAEYKDGVLVVTLPKLKGAPAEKKTIPVN